MEKYFPIYTIFSNYTIPSTLSLSPPSFPYYGKEGGV
jgi:hypothetical protein